MVVLEQAPAGVGAGARLPCRLPFLAWVHAHREEIEEAGWPGSGCWPYQTPRAPDL